MTERRSDPEAPTAELPPVPRPAPRRQPIRKPGPFAVVAGSLALFLAVTALLAFQMRAGADPALGAPEPQLMAATAGEPQATPAPRKLLIRRVIVTKVVVHRRRAKTATAPPTSAPAPYAPAPAAPATPIARVAPAPAAPAPARAPAPAPAPLTTKSS